MGTLAYTIDSLDKSQLKSPGLSLHCITSDLEFSFMITSGENAEDVIARGISFERRNRLYFKPLRDLPALLSDNPELFRSFSSVNIALRGIPCVLFQSDAAPAIDYASEVLSRSADIATGDLVCVDPIEEKGLYILYAIPQRFQEEVALYFGHATIRHIASVHLRYLLEEHAGSSVTVLLAISNGYFDLACTSAGQMKFFNQYAWNALDDIAYFTAAIVEDLGLANSGECLFIFAGSHATRAAINHLSERLRIGREYIEIPEGDLCRIFDLKMLARCAS